VKDEKITVEALGRERAFTEEELAEAVCALEDRNWFDLAPIDIAMIQTLAELNGAAAPTVREIARSTRFYSPERLKETTGLDGKCDAADEAIEPARAEAEADKEKMWAQERACDAEARKRLHETRGNPTKLSRAMDWVERTQAEIAGLRAQAMLSDAKLRRRIAAANALKLARDRLRQEQRVRVVHEGRTLTLAEFEEARRREGRR